MLQNDKYNHFKGGHYIFIGIAVPLEHHTNLDYAPTKSFVAKKEETLEEMAVYSKDGVLFTENDVFMVVYESYEDEVRWLRPVDDFFGYKTQEDGSLIKRFVLQTKSKEV